MLKLYSDETWNSANVTDILYYAAENFKYTMLFENRTDRLN